VIALMRTLRHFRLGLCFLAPAFLSACGSTEPEVVPAPLERIWRASDSALETTFRLDATGSVALVEAALAVRSCEEYSGSWTADGTRLVLRLTPVAGGSGAEERTFTYEVFEDRLVLTSGGDTSTFRPASDLADCRSYDFGTWTGTLSAEIDGVAQAFANISVTTALTSGILEVRACPDAGPTCEIRDAELVLNVDAPPGPLSVGTYSVQNIPGAPNFFALHDTHPEVSAFPGFNTERLLPPGEFVLRTVTEDRVVGTFSFRANEIQEGLSAPDGRRFVLVTNGVIDLEYR